MRDTQDPHPLQEPHGPPRRGGHRGRASRLLIAATSLVAVVAIAAAAYVLAQPRARRDPADFLPSSTRAAVFLDLRPEGAAMQQVRQVWPEADVAHLRDRGVRLAQELVEWTGLELDVGRDVAPWFGGQLAAAAVGDKTIQALRPQGLVLIASATSTRRAQASLARAVRPMARDLAWKRRTLMRQGVRISAWRDARGRDQVAYAARHGCLLVGASADTISQCLLAEQSAGRQLAGMRAYQEAARRIPADSPVWCYLDVGVAAQASRYLGRGLTAGWRGVLREYLRGALRGRERGGAGAAGVLAAALLPRADGVAIKAVYSEPARREAEASPAHLERLAVILPREAVAYVLVHRPGRWLPYAEAFPLPPGLGSAVLPEDLLIALVAQSGKRQPAIVMAAPSEQLRGPARQLAVLAAKGQKFATVGDLAVVASDQEALRECELAARRPERRLSPRRGAGTTFELWARASALSSELAGLQEVSVKTWEQAGGGEAEVRLRMRPRDLLGGRRRPPRAWALMLEDAGADAADEPAEEEAAEHEVAAKQ